MIRIAAFGDCHFASDAAGSLAPALARLDECADVLLLAGDLTRLGTVEEASAFAAELASVSIPVVAVLGNHDFHSDQPDRVTDVLVDAGVHVLDGDAVVLDVGAAGSALGVAGVKGFGTGFPGAMCSDFGEPEMKAFVRHSHEAASRLEAALASVADAATVRVALTHYAPVSDTLAGERLEIHPFLGSYHLAEAIDAAGADLAVHGHAHGGVEKGMTPGGVPVRNVAQPVIRSAYRVYCVGRDGVEACA